MGTLLETGLANAVLAALLAVVAAAAGRVFRRPALTHSLWLLVLLKLVTPPLVPLPVSWPAAGGAAGGVPAETAAAEPVRLVELDPSLTAAVVVDLDELLAGAEQPAAETSPTPPDESEGWPWQEALAVLWAVGAAWWLAWAAWHAYRFQRLLRFARPAPDELQEQARGLASRLGLKECPPLFVVPGAVSPMVWAPAGAPRLLFPAGLLGRLDREQRAALLAHELAHVRRRDHWVRLLEAAATALYWWHPVVWWARRELREAEEQCCDAWVLWALGGSGRAYALALLQTVAFFSESRPTLPVTASGVGQVPQLRRRLTMIMQGTTARSLSWAGCLAVTGLGLLLLPLAPVQAEPQAVELVVQGTKADGGQESVDQQIEALKKAIEVLEDMKGTEKRKVYEIKKIMPVEKDVLKKVEPVRVQVPLRTEVIEKKVQAAQGQADRLKKVLEQQDAAVTAARKAVEARQVIIYRRADLKDGSPEGKKLADELDTLRKQIAQKRAELQALETKQRELLARHPHRLQILATPAVEAGRLRLHLAEEAARVEAAKKGGGLEEKLDRLLKEVEELKREVRKETPKAK